MSDFPRIVSEYRGMTDIAVGYGYPSIKTDGPEFKPIYTIVVSVPTRFAARELERLRSEARAA